MNRYFLLLGLMVFMFVSNTACKKSSDTKQNNVTSLNTLFPDLQSSPQTFSVNAGRNSTFRANGGTVLNFYPNSFKDASENIITTGNVSIQLTEVYTPLDDMIQNRTITMTNGVMLQSAGEVNIVATQNGQEVLANKYGISFKQSTASSQPTCLYYYSASDTGSGITWNISDTTKSGTVVNGTTTITNTTLGYEIVYTFDSCTNFNWINCKKIHYSDSNKMLTVTLPDSSYKAANTSIFIVFPDLNAVITNMGRQWVTSTISPLIINLTSDGKPDIIPDGVNYKVLVMSNKNGSFYYYESTGIVSGNLNVSPLFEPRTESGLITLLSNL